MSEHDPIDGEGGQEAERGPEKLGGESLGGSDEKRVRGRLYEVRLFREKTCSSLTLRLRGLTPVQAVKTAREEFPEWQIRRVRVCSNG